MALKSASFNINYHDYLDNPCPDSLDINIIKNLYRIMLQVRLFDAKAVALQRTGQLGTFPSSLGQEALGAGIGLALQASDVFVTYYRDYAVQLLRGVTMSEILSYWGGSESGNHYQSLIAQQDLPVCIPIASQCLHAAGIATAIKLRKEKRAVLVTCGDGATSQGDFYETINIAGAWNLPLVIVINNNQWAISVPRSQQSGARTLAQKGIAGGISAEQVNGNDAPAVYTRVSLALENARQGKGPTLIEALTYRLCDHTTADDASRYRSKTELENAKQHDPLDKLKKYLFAQQAWSVQAENDLREQYLQEIDLAVKHYLATPPEPIENMFKFHYGEYQPDYFS